MELLAFLTALVVFGTAIVGYLSVIRKEVQQVHGIVNSRSDEQLDRIDQLRAALILANINIPEPPPRDSSRIDNEGEDINGE